MADTIAAPGLTSEEATRSVEPKKRRGFLSNHPVLLLLARLVR